MSITTAGTTSGTSTGWFGQQFLNEAKTLGFTPDNYSIMPFGGGFSGSGSQISALEGFHTTLMNTFGWDSATAYAREGISQMNGRSDSGECFYQSDFQAVLCYAQSKQLARFTFWSVNRDRQCSTPDPGTTSGTGSSVPQADWDFTRFSAQFAEGATVGGPTPTITPTPTSTPTSTTPAGGQRTGVAAWSPTATYVGGNTATYAGHLWLAKWWTYGDVPGRQGVDVWADQGAC